MNKMLVPEFFSKFKCIGSECEHTCCSGWEITIDKNTYFKYKKLKNKRLNKLINTNIELKKDAKFDNDYAKIKLNNKKECELLDDSKLCMIHKELGEDFLCYTCKTYPRVYNKVGTSLEVSLTVSCPEVARLALLNPNKIAFEYIEIKKNFMYYPHNTINKNENIFWEIRIFTLEVLQNRDFKLCDRLLILGLFFETVQEFVKNNKEDTVLSTINSFRHLLYNTSVDSLLNEFEVNTNFQLDLIKLLNDTRVKTASIDSALEECIKAFNEGLNIKDELTEEQYKIYRSNYTNYYIKYMDNHEYILENYLVNYVFINLFPFEYNKGTSFDEYCIMVLNYALIKTYLIGMSGYYKHLNDEIVIKLIHSLGRTYHHGNRVMEYVFAKLKEGNKMNMKNMSLLLKN